MRRPSLHLLALLLIGSWLVACTTADSSSVSDIPLQTPQPRESAFSFSVDPATFVTAEYRRTGGADGVDNHAQLFLDGHVILQQGDEEPVTFWLTPAEMAHIRVAFDSADFHRSVAEHEAPDEPAGEGYRYNITRRDTLLRSTLDTAEGAVPAWARPIVPLFDNLLLKPQPGRENRQSVQQTEGDAPQAPSSPVVIEFYRGGGDSQAEERVLVHVDRKYSIARDGVIQEGELDRDQMKELLYLMEGADLRANRGEYLSGGPASDQTLYALTYRTLMGAYDVTTTDEDMPDWFHPILEGIVGLVVAPDQLAQAGQSSDREIAGESHESDTNQVAVRANETPEEQEEPTIPAEATPTVLPTSTPTEKPTATDAPAATATPLPANTPAPAPTDTVTPEPADTATPEPADTATPEPVDTATPEPVDTATPEPTDTATPEPTDTPTPVDTDTPTATATPSPAPTDTPSPEPTATATPTPTPTATATSTPKPTNTPTVEPDPTDTATPASSVTLVPVPTATPAATSQALRRVPGLDTLTNGGETAAFPYTMVRFLGDMTDEGHDVVRTPARIVKPYLSVFGVIILIDGHPVQAFEYPDDETLAADMMGFGPGADSHGSHLLFWEAPPRVWRNGRLLLLTVGPDDFTSDAIASVLGDPIIGN